MGISVPLSLVSKVPGSWLNGNLSAILFEDGIRRVGLNHVSLKLRRRFQFNVLVMSKSSSSVDIALPQPL